MRRMVRDLDLPVALRVIATVRERDGLALSSRNARLGPAQRERALALSRGLDAALAAVADGERDGAVVAAAGRAAMAAAGVEPEYLAVVDPETLARVDELEGPALVVVAARIGNTRLIDNAVIDTEQVATPPRPAGGPVAAGRG